MARALRVAVAVALAGCAGSRRRPPAPLVDATPVESGGSESGRLLRELELEVLAGYQRFSLDATAAAATIDPAVGLTAIGVGPEELAASSAALSRWPITEVAGGPAAADLTPIEVVSRALELHVSSDRTVGWTFDQISLHLRVCGRVASVPLRAAQVYVRDNERWTLVAEHLAYAQPLDRWLAAARGPTGAAMPGAVERSPESAAALAVLTTSFALDGDRAQTWDDADDSLAVWPDPRQLLRGAAVQAGPSLAASLGASALRLEGTRLALAPGRSVAIAASSILASVEGGAGPVEVRLRASAVLERGIDGPWRVRMAMVSTPITAAALIGRTVGAIATSVTAGRVTVRCTDDAGRVATAR